MSKSVLIVDDSVVSRMMIHQMIASKYPHWSIIEAGDADEAVKVSQGVTFDFITIDFNMPGRTGLELAKELISSHSSAKIALLTANIQSAIRKKAEALEIEFIAKPIDENDVLKFIEGYGMSKTSFTELQRDAIIELVNMGIGKAAESLSQIIQDEVILSVPSVEFVDDDNLLNYVKQIDKNTPSAIMQKFTGDFCGNSMLIFPENGGMGLVRQMLQNTVESESISEFEEEALLEIGNIILNACFGQLGNLLSTDLDGELPIYIRAPAETILNEAVDYVGDTKPSQTMLLQVDFSLRNSQTKGFVLFTMDVDSLETFKRKVDEYLQKIFA